MAKAAIQPKHSYKGREYTFVDTSARVLEEFKCGICLNLVEDPVSTTCEHFFCRECIENQLTCPMCRRSFKVTSDRRSEKILMALSVKCPLTEKGCEWEGELGNVADHFEKACEYNEVDCPKGCGKVLKGPRDTVNKHLTYCGDFPLPCPAGCRSTRKRKEMKQHLSSECLEEVVSCKYALFGCNKTTKRRKIENHTSDDSFHFKKSMDAQLAIFNCHIKGFQSQSYQKPDLSVLPLSFRPWLVNNPTCYPCPPWVIRIKELKSSQRSRFESYHSTPVYSHYGGYKMEIRTTLTLLSVTFIFISFYLMKGENDKGLRLPFEGKIVVSLLNQLEDANHLRKEVHGTAGKEAGLQNIGSVLYIIDSDDIGLNDSAKNCQYLKDDCIFLRIDEFNADFN
jgi:hypothetical protein